MLRPPTLFNRLVAVVFMIVFSSTIMAAESFSCRLLVGDKPEQPFVIVGRVIDKAGRPIMGADVSLDPRGSAEFLNPYVSANTDENGCFKIVGFGRKKSQRAHWFLYTTDNFTPYGIVKISPPFVGHLSKLDPLYNGIPFVPGKRQVIDVGDVPVIFWYGSARLRFDDCPANKCGAIIHWETAEVSVVHCNSKKSVSRGSFSKNQIKKYVYGDDPDLVYLLPTGRWLIEIYNSGVRAPIATTPCFEVDAHQTLRIPVKLMN